MLRRVLTSVSTLAVIGIAPLAHAQTYAFFPNNTTINYAVNRDYAIVGYASGDINNGFQTPSSPTVNVVSGGSVGVPLRAYNSSRVNMSDGSFSGYLFAYNFSTINMSGGNVFDSLIAFDSSTMSLSGGSVGYFLDARGSSTMNMSGGNVGGSLFAADFSTMNVSGGSGGNNLYAADSSRVNVSGGMVASDLYAFGSSSLNFFGRGLMAPLINPNAFGFSLYSLSGTLLDGTVWTNKNLLIQNGIGARFTLNNVPEPGVLGLLTGGIVSGMMLLRRRKSVR